MTIKTTCHSCHHPFQVNDESACLLVTCPSCGIEQRVTSNLKRTGDSTENPYSAPVKSSPPSLTKTRSFAGMTPTKIRIRTVMGRCFKTFKRNLATLLVIEVIQAAIFGVLEVIRDALLNAQKSEKGMDISRMYGVLASLVFGLAVFTLVWFLFVKMRVCLRLLRGESAGVKVFFSGGFSFISAVLVVAILSIPSVLVFGLIAYLGNEIVVVVALVIATLIGLYIWPSIFLVVDRKASVLKSLALAPRFTDINYLNSFLIYLIWSVLPWAGVLFFCIGQFVTIPFTILFSCGCYLAMTGQLPPEATELDQSNTAS